VISSVSLFVGQIVKAAVVLHGLIMCLVDSDTLVGYKLVSGTLNENWTSYPDPAVSAASVAGCCIQSPESGVNKQVPDSQR